MAKRHLAITMGDPAGIGPEIIVKACARLRDRLAASDLKLLVIGSRRAFDQARDQTRAQFGTPIDVTDVAPSANNPASNTADFTCALAIGIL